MKHEHSNHTIDVVCAIIHIDGKILATQRSEYMNLPLKWEFPGGKLENGESEVECLRREVMEELNITIIVGDRLTPVEHDAGDVKIRLIPYESEFGFGKINLSEHAQFVLIEKECLMDLDWAEADRIIVEQWMND